MANHTWDNWRVMARYSYFDDWYDSEDTLDYDGYGLFDAELFGRMKPTAYLVNTARGPVVDEGALVAALFAWVFEFYRGEWAH